MKLGWVLCTSAIVLASHFSTQLYLNLNIFTSQDIQETGDFLIKPESKVASLDTSQWPLLLKVSELCFTIKLDSSCLSLQCKTGKACEVMKKFIHSLSSAGARSLCGSQVCSRPKGSRPPAPLPQLQCSTGFEAWDWRRACRGEAWRSQRRA